MSGTTSLVGSSTSLCLRLSTPVGQIVGQSPVLAQGVGSTQSLSQVGGCRKKPSEEGSQTGVRRSLQEGPPIEFTEDDSEIEEFPYFGSSIRIKEFPESLTPPLTTPACSPF